jgi:glyoxylase-like metal-dependent hydrolase (beta-lactamase superfamily II)
VAFIVARPNTKGHRVSEAGARARPGGNLDYPFPARPELGQAIEVAPGIHWIRMRLPMQLNHINLWLLEDGDGWTAVDCGIKNEETTQAWEQLFAGPMGGRPIRRVIVTHMHPDHIGLAGWLVRKFDVTLWITRTEFLMCRNLVADTGQEAPQEGLRFYRAAGFSDEMLETYKARFGGFGHGVYKLPSAYRRIRDTDTIEIGGRIWHVVTGNGHSPEHACLWCPEAGVVISGDQLLPRISSNVSVHPTEPEANPLQDWLDSCAKLKATLPEDVLVLPSHNEPFRGAHLRLQDLIDGHEDGMQKLRAHCAEPKRAVDCFPALFRAKITSGNYGMATGESLAHLNCLRARGLIARNIDSGGVDWYQSKV